MYYILINTQLARIFTLPDVKIGNVSFKTNLSEYIIIKRQNVGQTINSC